MLLSAVLGVQEVFWVLLGLMTAVGFLWSLYPRAEAPYHHLGYGDVPQFSRLLTASCIVALSWVVFAMLPN